MMQCSRCLELYDDVRYNNIVIEGLCKGCFRYKSLIIPLSKEQKNFENIIFNDKNIITEQSIIEFLNLENIFYNNYRDQYFKFLLFMINFFFIIFQIINFIYFNFNNFIIMIHIIILVYSEIILWRIRFKNRFEEYYMQIIYNYKKYNHL